MSLGAYVILSEAKDLTYSVETLFRLFKAPFIACHDSAAHLTREGYCQMPEKIFNLLSSFGSTSGFNSPSSRPWNSLKRCRASSSVLPVSATVIIDAEALLMAQPAPSNATL